MSNQETKTLVPEFDAHKFSINEIFSNNNGKTSSTKLVGFITSMACLLLFLSLVVFFFFVPAQGAMVLEFVDRTVTYFSISAGLMGVKSITSAFGKHKIEISEKPIQQKKETSNMNRPMYMNNNTEEDENQDE